MTWKTHIYLNDKLAHGWRMTAGKHSWKCVHFCVFVSSEPSNEYCVSRLAAAASISRLVFSPTWNN